MYTTYVFFAFANSSSYSQENGIEAMHPLPLQRVQKHRFLLGVQGKKSKKNLAKLENALTPTFTSQLQGVTYN